MGLTSWSGKNISRSDAEIAKNSLNEEELGILNRFVSMYLEFAELQALNKNVKDKINSLAIDEINSPVGTTGR